MRHLTGRMHGMARYGLELLKAVLNSEEDLAVGVLVRRPEHGILLPRDKRLVSLACNAAPYGVLSQMRMPRVLSALRPDVYHCPFYGPPATYMGPMVFTVHDLIHLRFPRDYGFRHRFFYRWVVGPAASRARAIFTVSRCSKKDLVELLGADPDKVVVTPNGVGPEFKPLSSGERESAARELGLPPGYILGVGNPKPHKNMGALAAARRILKQERERRGRSVPALVLVGVGPGELPDLAPGPDVVFKELEGDRELALAYGAAGMTVVPSLYEGFGLPALEAMSCGTPVITSNISSLPEIVGRAAVLVDPYDEYAIAEGLGRILSDEELRRRLASQGLEQAARFSWDQAARETMAVYRQVLSERGLA
jgi:glycosyltransferase involved in cell wall biosynthesis